MKRVHLLNLQNISKMDSDSFYIGWQEKMPAPTHRFLKRCVIALFIAAPLLSLLVVLQQRGFNNHRFELGQVKEITGIYYNSPVPVLYADEGVLPDSLSRSILLVGFGKFGAEGIMQEIQGKTGDLSGKKITLSGTLIYGGGHTVMELTRQAQSLVEVVSNTVTATPEPLITGQLSEEGEILDPKCYFGVMKPGQGKIHKSCAIRCLSGGIPPVFKLDGQNETRYFIILDEQGKKLNERLLAYVGSQVKANGRTSRFLDWEILYIDHRSLPLQLTKRSELCAKNKS